MSLYLYVSSRWSPPKYILEAPESKNNRIRKKWHILVEGDNIPPPIKSFKVCFPCVELETLSHLCLVGDEVS